MLTICESFASNNDIRFSTHEDPRKSKNKIMFMVAINTAISHPDPLVLCGKTLPWVDRCHHLGHTLTTDGKMRKDCVEKRASFIDSSVKIREQFNFAHPSEVVSAMQKYCSDFLWQSAMAMGPRQCTGWQYQVSMGNEYQTCLAPPTYLSWVSSAIAVIPAIHPDKTAVNVSRFLYFITAKKQPRSASHGKYLE